MVCENEIWEMEIERYWKKLAFGMYLMFRDVNSIKTHYHYQSFTKIGKSQRGTIFSRDIDTSLRYFLSACHFHNPQIKYSQGKY